MEKQLVIFELGSENFGIDISSVESIVKIQEITKIPQSLEYVEGITNFRGSVLPVIDLHKRFGMRAHQRTREVRIVVTNVGEVKVGMIVSAVSEVITIDDSVIEPPPPMINNVNSEFIVGIVKIEKQLVILLDLVRVLSQDEKSKIASIDIMNSELFNIPALHHSYF
ncbi:MAG: chemotaxis protein CheW [Anaerolinea sp.]|nr:chemotaxis protein CheW [Anaerolinea sp.]